MQRELEVLSGHRLVSRIDGSRGPSLPAQQIRVPCTVVKWTSMIRGVPRGAIHRAREHPGRAPG
jgi:hypothetical protein